MHQNRRNHILSKVAGTTPPQMPQGRNLDYGAQVSDAHKVEMGQEGEG